MPESLKSSYSGPQSSPTRLAASCGTYAVMGVGRIFSQGVGFSVFPGVANNIFAEAHKVAKFHFATRN